MNNPPAFQFYPQDFISDLKVHDMTMEERGVYITLLCHCWIEDGLPTKGGSRVVHEWFNQYPTVASCFYEKDDKFRNKRLDEEREKQKKWREKSAKGGRKSGVIRGKMKGGSRVVEPNANQRATLQSSSSSSSSPFIKEEKRKQEPAAVDVNIPSPFAESAKKEIPRIFSEGGHLELLSPAFLAYLVNLSWEFKDLDLEDEIKGKFAHWTKYPLTKKSNLCLQFRNWFRMARKIEADRQRERLVGHHHPEA